MAPQHVPGWFFVFSATSHKSTTSPWRGCFFYSRILVRITQFIELSCQKATWFLGCFFFFLFLLRLVFSIHYMAVRRWTVTNVSLFLGILSGQRSFLARIHYLCSDLSIFIQSSHMVMLLILMKLGSLIIGYIYCGFSTHCCWFINI